jgi:hypothetical protein
MLWEKPTGTGGQDDEMDMGATGIAGAGSLRQPHTAAYASGRGGDGDGNTHTHIHTTPNAHTYPHPNNARFPHHRLHLRRR